ncbi:MAG TPA: sulfatase-like hydrolase/transferase [Candidatus Krumholzibacteria bacterium]|nr:sulfatase-like hydrolase/transferase [Candidatus Krumholzibacteria bacterium]
MKLPGLITCALIGAAFVYGPPAHSAPAQGSGANTPPNIILILGDNIGYGELSCYDNSRMVTTPRLDKLASQGLRLTNFNMETWCAPSRAALLTGRFGIRTGTSQMPDSVSGITPWEITLPEVLSSRGYKSAIFGKWHLGDHAGRYPTDQGFDEFWGIAKSWDGGLITQTPGFIPKASTMAFILSGVKGKKLEEGEIFDTDTGQFMDRMIADKSIDFIQRMSKAKTPFFLYAAVAAVHLPIYVDPDFVGKSGAGPIGDAMMAIDFHVGRILDAIDAAGIADNTIVIFTSDDGPEYQDPYRGTAGPWSGNYNTAMEGSLRVPFIMRWPARVAAGRTSNEIVHVTDMFTTLANIAGAKTPGDRLIDGINQTDFLTGKKTTSNRDAFPVYLFGQLAAVKYKDWKLHLFWKPRPDAALENRRKLFNLRNDPKEEYDVFWQQQDIEKILDTFMADFANTLRAEPPVPPGAPDTYRPAKKK